MPGDTSAPGRPPGRGKGSAPGGRPANRGARAGSDRRYKLVRCYAVTDASVHDSRVIGEILDPDNTAAKVWADKAYRSEEIEGMLEELGYSSMIMRKGSRGGTLTKREMQGNGTKAKIRARVEHVFGAQENDMGGTVLRSIGIMRARRTSG